MSSKCLKSPSFDNNYQSTTSLYHRFIPNVPQEFDCRIKLNLKHDLLQKDIKIKDGEFKTSYEEAFYIKSDVVDKSYRPPLANSVNYLRNVQEKLFDHPPSPISPGFSEMKDRYRLKYSHAEESTVRPPALTAKCLLTRLGCEQQPAISPENKGYWKWSDPYLTTNRATFIPFNEGENGGIDEKILTFYNESQFELPPASGNKTMFDVLLFTNCLPNRLLYKGLKRVPNSGMKSEQQAQYVNQCFSDLYPFIRTSGTEFEDALPEASRWQTLPPPGMYCTEYCHIGRWPVRAVVDPQYPKNEIRRTENCKI